jgi:hypothetical protein
MAATGLHGWREWARPSLPLTLATLKTKLTPSSDQWKWHAPCEVEQFSPDPAGLDIEGDIEEISKAQLDVGSISECARLHSLGWGHDELYRQLSAAEADGTVDAVEMFMSGPIGRKTIVVNVGLRPKRYELFRTFVTLHFGRSDLIGRISTTLEFAASSELGLTYKGFLKTQPSRPYVNLEDNNIEFRAKPLPGGEASDGRAAKSR